MQWLNVCLCVEGQMVMISHSDLQTHGPGLLVLQWFIAWLCSPILWLIMNVLSFVSSLYVPLQSLIKQSVTVSLSLVSWVLCSFFFLLMFFVLSCFGPRSFSSVLFYGLPCIKPSCVLTLFTHLRHSPHTSHCNQFVSKKMCFVQQKNIHINTLIIRFLHNLKL